MPNSWKERPWLWTIVAALLLSRLVLAAPGLLNLATGEAGVDLETRRTEWEWVLFGVDPVLAVERLRAERGKDVRVTADLPPVDEIEVGALADGGTRHVLVNQVAYPPWSYPLMSPGLWPAWPATQVYFAVVAAACFLGVLIWARRLLDGAWGWGAVFVCLLPASSWAVGFHLGQWSAPIMLALALLTTQIARRRAVASGVLLGWASLKPTSSALFALLLLAPALARRTRLRWTARAAVVAGSIVAAGTLLVWARVGTDPWSWLRHLGEAGGHLSAQGYGLLPVLEAWAGFPGSGISWAMVLPLAFALATGVALAWLRDASLLVQAALVGLSSRLWTYHQHWDDVLLIFLLLALWMELRRGSLLSLLALLAVATTLATPTPSSELMGLWRVLVWLLAAAVLVGEHRRGDEALAAGDATKSLLLDGPRIADSRAL